MISRSARAIEALLTARSVAVVGVSRDPARLGSRILASAISNGFAGKLYGVARSRFAVDGAEIVESLEAIPGTVDIVLLAVPAEALASAAAALCADKCRIAIAIASGFAEIGAKGEALERDLVALCHARGIALIGPNCQGVVIPRQRLQLTFSPMYDGMSPGPIAIVSQSGAMGGFMANRLMQRGLGISAFVSSGNESILNVADYVEELGRDPQTRVILTYLEQIREGRRFCDAVRNLPAGKSVLVVKSGRGAAGVAAVRSHTGAIAGDDAVIDAVLDEIGAIRMTDSAAAIDAAAALAGGRLLRGRRIGVLSIAGGLAVETADLLEMNGLEVPRFAEQTIARLREIVPEFGATHNPIDLTGAVLTNETLFERALAIMADAADLDGFIVISTFVSDPRLARAIVELHQRSARPVLVCWTGAEAQTRESLARLRQARVPVFDTPARAALAMASLYRAGRGGRRQRPLQPVAAEAAASDGGATARAMIDNWQAAGRRHVHEADAKRWLRAGGVTVPPPPQDGATAVVKLCSDSHLHKTEHGLVRLRVDAAALDETCRALERQADTLGIAQREILIEAFLGDGLLEWIVGCRNDPTMGPVIVLGTGGIYAELFPNAIIGTAPLSVADAEDLIRRHPAFPIINGARGRPVGDIGAFAAFVARVGNLFAANRHGIDELDLNPVIVRPAGQPHGVVALDAALILRGSAAG